MSNFPTLNISATQTIDISRPLINSYHSASKTAIDNHVSGSTDKHAAEHITYSGTVTSSTTVLSAINTVHQLVNAIIVDTAGSTAEVITARTAVNGIVSADLSFRLNNIENMAGNVISKTADATLLLSERGIIKVTDASANITITLPSSATTHIAYTIQKTFTGSETVTIVATASQTIEGTTAGQTLTSRYDKITVLSDGSNWNVVGGDLHLNMHKEEIVFEQVITTWPGDSQAVQTISGLSGIPKRIEVRANKYTVDASSIGSWTSQGNKQSCINIANNTTIKFSNDTIRIATIFDSDAAYLRSTIQNVISGQFEINWIKTGTPTNANIDIEIDIFYH